LSRLPSHPLVPYTTLFRSIFDPPKRSTKGLDLRSRTIGRNNDPSAPLGVSTGARSASSRSMIHDRRSKIPHFFLGGFLPGRVFACTSALVPRLRAFRLRQLRGPCLQRKNDRAWSMLRKGGRRQPE